VTSGWRQIVWQLIRQRLTSYCVPQVTNHPIHHLHLRALQFYLPLTCAISAWCSTVTCHWRLMSVSYSCLYRTPHQELPTRTHLDYIHCSGGSQQLDYCNILLAGCTKHTFDKSGGDSRHHVTPLLRDHLHWLRARERISFKLCIPRPCTMLSERHVHSSVHCSQPFCSPFCCSWWFGRTQNKATTRQPGILCGWCGRLEQSNTGHSFGTYIINVQKHAQSRHICPVVLLHWSYFTDCFQSTSSEHCTAPL